MVYYAGGTPIGQVMLSIGAQKRNMVVGAVGMGTGSIAAYNRPDDEYRFYEIDKLVVDISSDPKNFSFINGCSKGKKSVVMGDARLTLQREKPNVFDVLLVDAFSSDAVPAHLLTVEAMKGYLERIRPDGIVIMHLSNRHLDLMRPVAAVAEAAGGFALQQRYRSDPMTPQFVDSSEDVIIVGKTPEAIKPFQDDIYRRWSPAVHDDVKPWTDDYTNLFSALVRNLRDR
jgi:spermidine synthase